MRAINCRQGRTSSSIEAHQAADLQGQTIVIRIAEHHDGWANWDSDLTPWNAVDKGPRRDLAGDLGKAVRAKGLKYVPSYHRERHKAQGVLCKGEIRGPQRTASGYRAVALRSRTEKPLGAFRWIVWAISPVSAKAENTAFQELAVE